MLGELTTAPSGAGAASLPGWSPLSMPFEVPETLRNYYYNYMANLIHHHHQQQQHHYHHAAAAAAVVAAAKKHDHEAPKAKRRKTTAQSHPDWISGDSAKLLSQRGSVTFKPYTDDGLPRRLMGNASCSGLGRKGLEESRPLKRRLGQSAPIVRSRGTAEERQSLDLEEDAGKTTVAHLFPEILTNIFQYLDVQSKGRVAKVCTRWKEAVYRKSCWKGVEAKLHLGKSNPHLYPSLVRRGIKKVQVLSLRRSLRELMNGIPNLESLNLSGCYNLSDSALDGAFNKDLLYLKTLNLSLCKEVSDNSLGRIATHCKNLKELNLGGCSKITNTGLLLVSWGLKHIEIMNLRSCRQISDNGIAHLAGVGETQNPGTPKGTKSLRELGLQDCQKLTDEALRHLSEGLPDLKKVNLSFCVSVTDTGLKSLAGLAGLEELNLRSCDNVSDIGIGYLAEQGSRLGCLDISFCSNVSDASMKHLASGMAHLRCLSMTTCAVTDDGLDRVSENLRQLEELNIGQCVAVTDKGLNTLVDKLKKLRVLDLYGCPKLTSVSLAKAKELPQMQRLNLDL